MLLIQVNVAKPQIIDVRNYQRETPHNMMGLPQTNGNFAQSNIHSLFYDE
jgi:hypothetical protein